MSSTLQPSSPMTTSTRRSRPALLSAKAMVLLPGSVPCRATRQGCLMRSTVSRGLSSLAFQSRRSVRTRRASALARMRRVSMHLPGSSLAGPSASTSSTAQLVPRLRASPTCSGVTMLSRESSATSTPHLASRSAPTSRRSPTRSWMGARITN